MRTNRNLHLAAILILAAACCVKTQAQDTQAVAVILRNDNPVNNLSLTELRRVLLGDRKYWSGSQRIILLMPKVGTPQRDAIMRLLHMSESDFQKSWLNKVYAGDADAPPAVVPTSGAAVSLVSDAPGAIALVPPTSVKGGVKIAKIDGLSPADSTYPLR